MSQSAYFQRIESKYGLSQQAFLELLVDQESRCPGCDRELVLFSTYAAERPCVDHCHTSGRVRGLLCHTCNVSLGHIEKDTDRTLRLLRYSYERGRSRKFQGRQRRMQQGTKKLKGIAADLAALANARMGATAGEVSPRQLPKKDDAACDGRAHPQVSLETLN